MRQGLTTYRTTGTVLDLPWYLGVLAEAYGSTGQAEAGLALLEEALAAVDKTDFYEAALYGLKGAFCWARRPRMRPKRRCVSSRPSLLPVASKPNPGSCGRR